MISTEFEFAAPATLDRTLTRLGQDGAEAKVLAGGMSLMPMMRLGLAHPGLVLSRNRAKALASIEVRDGALCIGALVRHARIARDPLVAEHAPLLALAAGAIGDAQIRNRGTVGASLSHADPAADYPAAMLALKARIHVRSTSAERIVPIEAFFVDVLRTAPEPDELLVAVEIPLCAAGHGYAHERLWRVEGAQPIVLASPLIAPGGTNARIALGGVAVCPVLLELDGATAADEESALEAAGARAYAAAAGALEDLIGGVEYRRDGPALRAACLARGERPDVTRCRGV